MDEILYLYDEEENTFQGVDLLKQIGNVRQICRGFLKNQYQILSDTGCLYYLEIGKSFYKVPTWNSKVSQIATNQSVTLLLTYSGQLFGFGEDKLQLGLLGNEKCYSSLTPIKIANDYKSVSLSQNIACALDYRGQPWIWGNSPLGKSDIPIPIEKRYMKMSAAKDYIIFTTQQAQVEVLSDIFKLSNEYFTSQKLWAITNAEQIDTTYLIVTEILPNDKYTILLTNKNRMFLLVNNNGKYIIRRLAINIRIHHLQQSECFIYCFTEMAQLIKIDKANLYTNETSELQHLNEQIRYQIPEQEQKHLSSIQPILASKYPFNLPSFTVDRRRFNEGISVIHQQPIEVNLRNQRKISQSRLSILSPQPLLSSRIKAKAPTNIQRNYYSPQQNQKIRILASALTTPKRIGPTFLAQSPSPMTMSKSYITEQNAIKATQVKKANLIRLLIQDIKNSINNLTKLGQTPVDIRDRTHSRRSSSVHIDQVQSAIFELGCSQQRNSSHEKKLNNSFNSRLSQHDNKNTNASSLFQSEQDLIEELRSSEPLDMIEEEYLEYDEETDQVKRVLYRKMIDQDYEYGNNLKVDMGAGKILLSRKLVNVTDEDGWNRNENGELKKVINEQEPQQFLEEEILIENPKTGQLTRKIVRVPYTDQNLQLGEGLNEKNSQGQTIIGRRLVANEQSTELLQQEGWVSKESKLERVLANREPNKYVEEEILEINPSTGEIERKLIRRKQDKNRKLEPGQKLISSRIVDNVQSSKQLQQEGWECNFNLGTACKILENNEEDLIIVEEEIIIIQQKKQDRKLIRRVFFDQESIDKQELEFGENLYEIQMQGIRIIARRYIQGEGTPKVGWKYVIEKQYWEKIIMIGESCKYVQITLTQVDYQNYQLTKKQVRSDLEEDEKKLILGEELNEQVNEDSVIVARSIGENTDSSVYLQQQGWNRNEQGQLEKIISIDKIEYFYEEEILIQNVAAGKQQRKLVRRPVLDGQKSQLGDDLSEQKGDNVIVSRKIVKQEGQQQNWKKNDVTKNLEKILVQSEPIEFVEEEVLTFNQQTGMMVRQIVKRPSVGKEKMQFGELKEVDKDGNIIVKRTLVPNLKLMGQEWTRGSMGSYRQTIAEEPEEYVEEEIIVVKDGKQERKLIRRPFNQEDLAKNYGEELQDYTENGERIVARRVVGNDQSQAQLQREGWQCNENGELEIKQIEPSQYIVEEILSYNKETGNYERKMIKRQLQGNDKLQMGENLNEVDKNGNKVLSRQIIQNTASLNKQKEEGWTSKNGNLEKVISVQEPDKYIEEEVLIQRNGVQERKLIRRPYNNQQLNLGVDLNEDQNGMKVVSRKIVNNDQSTQQLQNEKWVRNNQGLLELQLAKAEPVQFVEEEVLAYNEETGQMERKLVRRQFNQQKDGKLQTGVHISEVDSNGNRILSRKIVDNTKSVKQDGWQKLNNGTQVKVISQQEPEAFIEEEVLVVNPKTGKQERKLIRRPYNQDEDVEFGDALNQLENGQRVVARRIVQNDQSIYASNDWKPNQNVQEIILNSEPTQYIEEEILFKDKNGTMVRKIVRRPLDNKQVKTGNVGEQLLDGTTVLNRKIVDNTFSQAELKNWTDKGKGVIEQVISTNEPEFYIEQEVLVMNPKTGKQERKLIRKPYNNQDETFGDELNEQIGPNTRVISRKIVPNDHSSSDWNLQGGQLEQVLNANEPTKYIEEEILVRNDKTGKLERKLIRRPQGSAEQAQGVTVLSKKVVDNLSNKGWDQKGNNFEKVLNPNEVEEYIEEEIIIQNQKTGKQERKLIRRGVNDPPSKEGIVVSSKRVPNEQSIEQQKQDGWVQQDGKLVKVISKNEPTKMIIEEVLQLNEETGLMERKLIKRPIDSKSQGTVLSSKVVDNTEPSNQGWQSKNGQFEQILCEDEPEQFIEEEIIIVNPKTGKQERKLVRRPYVQDEEIGEQLNESLGGGKKVVARRIVQNNQTSEEMKQWKKNGEVMEKQIAANEPTKYIEEEVLIMNPQTKQLERVLIRKEYQPCKTGQVNEFDENGDRIVSRKVVDNTESSQSGWQKVKGILKKVVAVEPTKYVEEEVLIINQKTGKQERRLIRRPLVDGQDPGELGDSLDQSTEEGYKVVSRKIVDNIESQASLAEWQNNDGVFSKKLAVEPIKYIEEEVLMLNQETGMMERKIIKKPYNPSTKLGNNINSKDNQGNLVLSRKVVENNQSLQKSQWKQGQSERIIQEEPAQYIEEEVLVMDPKTGQQERKIIRKPYYGQDLQIGDELDEEIEKNQVVVSRKIVDNEQSLEQLKQWKKVGDDLVQVINKEPSKYIEEEVLVRNPETGMTERKIIRREQNSKQQYDKVLSRKVVDNRKSSIVLCKEGWKQNQGGAMEVVVSEEPEQFIEEEIITINPKTGKQERKLVRRPYYGEDIIVSDELNESMNGGQRVVARRIVENDAQINWEKKNDQYEKKIAVQEPTKYIEEEIVSFNEQTGMVEKKVVRRRYTKAAKLGEGLNEETQDGVVLARRVVDNFESSKKLEEWQNQNGIMSKIVQQTKPDKFIEEEVIVQKNGKQERKIVRKPILYEQQIEEDDDLDQDLGNGQKVVSRKIVSAQQQKDFQFKNGVFEKSVQEPTKLIEEEILVYNEKTGMMDRKLIRRPFTEGQRQYDEDGNQVLSSKIIDNNKSLNQTKGWKTLPNGQKEIILASEPEKYFEEEVLIFKNGKAERKIVRRPCNGEELPVGQDLNEVDGNVRVLSRKVVDNNLTSEQKSQWAQENGQLEKVIAANEPIKYIEEEVLVCNEETGMMERKIVRRPFTQKDAQLKQGGNLSELNNSGDVVVSRKIVENTLTEEGKKQWNMDKSGKMEKLLASEPIQYIEEEVVVVNKNGKQERKLVRRPYTGQDVQLGDELNESRGNTKVVSRRLVNNNQSSEEMQKWQKKGEQIEIVLNKEEPTQLVVEEVLVYNAEKGVMERKLVTRPLNSKQQDDPNVKVLSRKVIDNLKSVPLGEQVIAEEPEEYIEEEIITINPKTGNQERKLVRRPYNGEDVNLGDDINESGQKGERIICRRIVKNEETRDELSNWKQQQDGTMSKIIVQSEPTKYIEEEVLVCNEETGLMERKILRRPLTQKDLQLKQGGNLQETNSQGDVIVSRKIVENNQSEQRKKSWIIDKNGKMEKVISQEPIQFIEEEIVILNKNGKQERKLIRRPYTGQEVSLGEELNENKGNTKVVARRIVDNKESNEEMQKWQKNGEQIEITLNKEEPSQVVIEEVLVYNSEKGVMERKLVTRSMNSKQQDDPNVKVLSRKVVENLKNAPLGEQIIAEEPEQYIEEEVITINPRTGKQERKLVRRPYFGDDVALGDDLDESGQKGERIISRRIVQNEETSEDLANWKQQQDGTMSKVIAQNEPIKYIEEEVLVLNPETQQMERKLIRKPYNPNAKLGAVKETDSEGNVIVNRKVVENKQSQRRWTVKQDGKLEQVISKAEPVQYIEEEILILNPKTNQMERKIIRRPMQEGDSELATGTSLDESRGNQKVVSRRVVQNEQSQEQLQKEGWVNSKGVMELVKKEPVKYIVEEVLVQTEDGQLIRKLVRKPHNPKLQLGSNLQETDKDGNKILSRVVMDNNQSLATMKAEGWDLEKQEKIVSQEPLQYIEEEVIIVNPVTGKQERKIIRKPYYNEDLQMGDTLNEINGGQRVLARRIVENEQSLNQLNEEGWKMKDGVLEITITEPSQMIEEEVLVYNEESGLYERKLIRRQFDAKRDSMLQLGQLKEFDDNGNKILSRKIVDNLESSQSLQKSGWVSNNEGVMEKVLNVEEPEKFIEEEVLIINPRTGKQERRLTRRPYQPGDEKIQFGDNILDQQGTRKVVSRRIVENDQSSEFQLQQGWKQISAGMFEVQLSAAEPIKYIEEEILIVNKQTKQMQRKLIRRQYQSKDQNLQFGDDIKEKDAKGNRILARRLIENIQSLTQLKKDGWTKQTDGTWEKLLAAIAQKFIEEEILVYNPRTGKQERRLTRRPVMLDDDRFKVGEQINEKLEDGTQVVARRIVDSDFALTSWQQNEEGVLVHQLSEEPLKYIEEEVLQVNPETGQLERKLIRRPYTDQKLNIGSNINENKDGTIVLSRKVVENNESLAQWKRQSNGQLVKVINYEEPEQYVEEEILTINAKTGKQERKIIRRPFTEEDRNAIIGDQIIDEISNGQKVISRKIVSNQCSSENWKLNEDGNFEILVAKAEPIKYIEEEVLQLNKETGMMERKLIRKVFSAQAQLGNNLQETDEQGNVVISRRVVENLLSTEQQKKDGWKQIEGTLELLLNPQESLQMVEEQILIKNPETGKQELILRRRPYIEGEELQNPTDGLLLSRKIVKNDLSQGQLFNEGWSKTQGFLEKKIHNAINPQLSNKSIQDDPTTAYYIEEDHILTNPQTEEQEIHELKYPYQGNQHLKIGEGLRERDEIGNQIIARKIVTNIDPDYNPYQDVEEITEIIEKGKPVEFYAIQKLVNITEVVISKQLFERQPNGFIIRSRVVINEYQKTQQQGWRRLSDAEVPPNIRQWHQGKRSMYQIDEDSQEHRDSQYRSVDEQNQIRIMDQKLSVNGKYVEEEILIKNTHTNKYERRLQRRYTAETTLGDDLEEMIGEVKYLARLEVQYQVDLVKQGWVEVSNQVLQKIVAKNETLQLIQEEYENKEKHIQMFILKPYRDEQIQIGELDELQDNGLHLIKRLLMNNRSQAYFKANDYIKNKDGTYIKQIKGGTTMKIPKYQESNFVRRPTQRLSQIQSIEQHTIITKIGVSENGQDEPAIVNRTTNSDISESDKMLIKQLERGSKKDRSNIYQNILNDEQLRGRINSDKNNKSPSTPFSECAVPNKGKIMNKVLGKLVKLKLSQGLNELQMIYIAYRQKKRGVYQQNATNIINVLSNLFFRQSFDCLIEHMQKNVIEFDEDDVIKYNQMLDENKIIAMDIQPTGNEGQAAEPVELNMTPPEKKKILKIKQKGSPDNQKVVENKVYGSNSQHETQHPFQRKSVAHNTMKVQNPHVRQSVRASTVLKMSPFQSSQSLKPVNQSRGSQQNIQVPYGLQQQAQKSGVKKQTSKFKDAQEKSNSQSNKQETPLSQSYATISQNQSQASIQKQMNQEQLAQIQKNKIASQFKRMGSIQLTGTFKKP